MIIMSALSEWLSEVLWGPWTVALVLLSGAWLGVSCGWLQLRPGVWMKCVVRSLRKRPSDENAISPLQSATTALAGTLGTGNIVGVATALTLGGAGAIFWMWIAAVFGMMVSYAETVLGMLYRRKTASGEWLGGPMLYMERGLGKRWLAGLWAVSCAVAAFGVGNLTQVNSIAHSADSAWGVPVWVTSALVALLAAPVLLRGVRTAARLTEKLIPLMTAAYILACAAALVINYRQLPAALREIFSGIFAPSAAGGGILGAMMVGVRRGIFTNEAGLGSSVLVHSSADCEQPCTQGMWGIFEVFADTIVMCTMTALVILTSGAMSLTDAAGMSLDGAALSSAAFVPVFGEFSGSFITIALMLFAFATVISWGCCGEKAFTYLCGTRYVMLYRTAYTLAIILGGFTKLRTIWALSDILNGLMLIPNTVAVLLLWRRVAETTRSQFPFISRRKKHSRDIKAEKGSL